LGSTVEKVVLAGEPDTRYYIGGSSTAYDHGRPPIDHGIRNRSSHVKAILAGTQHSAANRFSEVLDGRLKHCGPPVSCPDLGFS